MKSRICLLLVAGSLLAHSTDAQPASPKQAQKTLNDVISFYRTKVGYKGAYLWRYSSDLKYQEGEGIATRTSGWTQPPGTPSVGEAYLKAWRLSSDNACLEAASEAAHALVNSQLVSGGWSSHFDLGPDGRRRYTYRVDGDKAGRNNLTTFDDNKSQSALMLLMHMDEVLQFKDAAIHEAAEYALKEMLAAQYPNGAWPQQYNAPPNPEEFPVRRASYPETWSRTYPGKRYVGYYTLNDNNMSFIVEMLLEAHRIYDRDDCYDAALKTGDFFVLAQMPAPQPGWAQQYDRTMVPSWARKFEPASITGGESQAVMMTLLKLYSFTGEARFLKPVEKALSYYKSSTLPDGRLARFYELKTNKPLYFTREYKLTYSDADTPTHYAFKVGSKLDSIEKNLRAMLDTDPKDLKPKHSITTPSKLSSRIARDGGRVIDALDSRNAWIESGKMRHNEEVLKIIDMRTFIRNLETLARLAGAK